MARRPRYDPLTLRDGRKVPYGFKVRNRTYYVRFPDPDDPAGYKLVTTGRTTEGEAFAEAAGIIREAYGAQGGGRDASATWEAVLADVKLHCQLRERSFAAYESAVRNLRGHVTTGGPGDVTAEKALEFRRKYATGSYARSNRSDARRYPREPKTIENAVRRLSGLWSKYLRKLGYVSDNPWEHVERPTVPTKTVRVPSEDDIAHFVKWVRKTYPGWTLLHAFLDTKMLAVCRLNDLCSVRSEQLDPKAKTLTIEHGQDKTHRDRVIPLPDDLCRTLNRIKGPTHLWEGYVETARTFRPGRRNKDEFSPRTLYRAILDVFEKYNRANPDRPVTSHDFRRRGITLAVVATGGNVDEAADAIGVHPATARQHYIDRERAFKGRELLKKMADVLRPKRK